MVHLHSLSPKFPGGAMKNLRILGLWAKSQTSGTWNRSVNHYATTFSVPYLITSFLLWVNVLHRI